MAKKIRKTSPPVKARRTNSMEKCIEDAQDYIKAIKGKKINKTKTMAKTIEEGKKMLAPKPPAIHFPAPSKGVAKHKKAARPTRPAVPALPPPPAVMPLPPVPIPTISSAVRTKSKSSIQKATILKPSSKDLPLPAFGFIDICFCLDATGSMCSQLAQVQSTIAYLIEKIENKVKTEGITLRFAAVAYRDHCDSNVIESQDFSDAQDVINFVNKQTASGGGDEPEAAHDGLLHACTKLNWVDMSGTPMLRYIFHILDAPPHGKEFGTYQAKEGCTCGITTDAILHEINLKQIHYRMIKVRSNPKVDIAETLFKGRMGNFDSVDISHAREMDIKVSDMVMMEVFPQA